MTGVDTIVTKADIMEEEIHATTETAEGQLTTIIPIILLVDIEVVALLLYIHVVVALLQGEGKYVFFFLSSTNSVLLNDSRFLTNKDYRVYLGYMIVNVNRSN